MKKTEVGEIYLALTGRYIKVGSAKVFTGTRLDAYITDNPMIEIIEVKKGTTKNETEYRQLFENLGFRRQTKYGVVTEWFYLPKWIKVDNIRQYGFKFFEGWL